MKRSKTVKITGLRGQNYIGVGLSEEKQLTFEGNAGDFFGALNDGAIINLNGTARRFVGDTMSKGGIIVKGNTQRGVGLGMTGGIIVIRGNVNGDVGHLVKNGTIIVSGNAGPRIGAFMFNGELIIAGDVGKDTGLFMMGGAIYVCGKVGSLGNNAQTLEPTDTEKMKLKKYFDHYGIKKETDSFKKIIPKSKNPWKDKSFDIMPTSNLNEDLKGSNLQSLMDEINSKTKTGRLNLQGPNIHLSSGLDQGIKSYYDGLMILPNQTTPIKGMKLLDADIETKQIIGSNLKSPLNLDIPIYLSTRGPGIVSKSSKMAFIYAAAKSKTAVSIGGLTLAEEIEISKKYNGKLIHQWDIARLGTDINYLNQACAIEIVIGSAGAGAFPSIIPSYKITPELAKAWDIGSDADIVLPPKMFDFDVPADLKRHVELLREATDYKIPILIKLTSGAVYEDTKLAVRAGVDAIVIEGVDSANQNVPQITANNLGLPSIAAIPPAVKALKDTRADKRNIRLMISGMFRNGADIFKALALGADAVVLNKPAEIAIGCTYCGKCNSNTCPVGIATTAPKQEAKLDWVNAGQLLTNFLNTLTLELKLLMILSDYKNVNEIDKDSLRAINYDVASITGTKLAGYDNILSMWEH